LLTKVRKQKGDDIPSNIRKFENYRRQDATNYGDRYYITSKVNYQPQSGWLDFKPLKGGEISKSTSVPVALPQGTTTSGSGSLRTINALIGEIETAIKRINLQIAINNDP
jgi:hypothetical protein